MVWTVITLVVITFIPAFELRASIPYGFYDPDTTLSMAATVFVCVAANIALAPVVWLFLDKGIHIFLRVQWIQSLYDSIVVRTQDKVHPYIERWGTLGLALFIGVPLPGSGVYSGGLGAFLLGFRFHQFMVASVFGVLIAGTLVTLVVVSGTSAFEFVLKH